MKKLKKRWEAKTPSFWKKIQKIAIVAGTVAGVIIAAPVALPAAVISVAGYVSTTPSALSTVRLPFVTTGGAGGGGAYGSSIGNGGRGGNGGFGLVIITCW